MRLKTSDPSESEIDDDMKTELSDNDGPSFSLRRQLIEGALGSFLLKVSQTGVGFILAVFMARLLGVDNFGIYAFCLSVMNLLTVPAMMGGDNFLVREVSRYRSKGEFHFLRGLLQFTRKASLTASIIIALSAIGIGWWIYQHSSFQLPFLIAMSLIPFVSVMNLQGAVLRGLRHVLLGQANTTLLPTLVIALIGFLIWFPKTSLNPTSALIIYGVSVILLVVIGHILLRHLKPKNIKNIISSYEKSKWVKSMLPFVFSGSMQILNSEASVVLLGIIQGPKEVGLFRVAQRGAMLIPFGLIAVNMPLAPIVAELFAKGDMEQLQHMVNKSWMAIIAFSLPMGLLLILGGQKLIPLAFGNDYQAAYLPMVILCIGQLFNVCTGSVGVILNMVGLERLVARGVTIAAVCNIILNISLISSLGLSGAAIACTISLVIWNTLLAIWLYRETGLISFMRTSIIRSSKEK